MRRIVTQSRPASFFTASITASLFVKSVGKRSYVKNTIIEIANPINNDVTVTTRIENFAALG